MIEIKRDDLITGAKILGLVPSQQGVHSSDFLRIIVREKEVEMAAASSVLAMVRIPWVGGKKKEIFFIHKNLLLPFVLAGEKRKGDFKLTVSEGTWYLEQGRRKAEIALRADEVGGYGIWDEDKGKQELKLSQELKEMLLASNNCATADPSLQQFNCVYIGSTIVLASNSDLIFAGSPKRKSDLQFPFPVGIIPLLGDPLVQSISVHGDKVLLDCGMGYIEGTVSAKTKDFPKRRILENLKTAEKWPKVLKLPGEQLAEALGRIRDYLSGVGKADLTLRVEVTPGVVRLIVKVPLLGKFEESFKTNGKEQVDIEWPLAWTEPILLYMAAKADITVSVDEKAKSEYLISGSGVQLIVGRPAKK